MKRLVALLACTFLVVSCLATPSIGMAADQVDGFEITPMYTYVDVINAALSISGSTAYCSGGVASATSYSLSLTVTLRRKSGSSWLYVTSWSANGSGIAGADVDESYKLTTHGDYKVVVVAKVKNSSGVVLETVSLDSSIKTY